MENNYFKKVKKSFTGQLKTTNGSSSAGLTSERMMDSSESSTNLKKHELENPKFNKIKTSKLAF